MQIQKIQNFKFMSKSKQLIIIKSLTYMKCIPNLLSCIYNIEKKYYKKIIYILNL